MSQVLLPFPNQADFVICFARDRSWKTLVQLQRNSTADEVFSVKLIRDCETWHLQFETDACHRMGDVLSVHAGDRSEAGNGSEPAVKAHRSAIISECYG